MNKYQLIVLWLGGLLISFVLCSTGMKLLAHASSSAEMLATGYPFTLIAGTAWTYIAPTIIIGIILMVSLKGHRK